MITWMQIKRPIKLEYLKYHDSIIIGRDLWRYVSHTDEFIQCTSPAGGIEEIKNENQPIFIYYADWEDDDNKDRIFSYWEYLWLDIKFILKCAIYIRDFLSFINGSVSYARDVRKRIKK